MKSMGLKCDKMTLRELDDKKIVKLSNLLCAFPVSVTGYGDADKAQVSSGGFKLSKLDDNLQAISNIQFTAEEMELIKTIG